VSVVTGCAVDEDVIPVVEPELELELERDDEVCERELVVALVVEVDVMMGDGEVVVEGVEEMSCEVVVGVVCEED
jgi:hypothetical protein